MGVLNGVYSAVSTHDDYPDTSRYEDVIRCRLNVGPSSMILANIKLTLDDRPEYSDISGDHSPVYVHTGVKP